MAADSGDKRAGLALLLRKVLKTCHMAGVPELDLVALRLFITLLALLVQNVEILTQLY